MKRILTVLMLSSVLVAQEKAKEVGKVSPDLIDEWYRVSLIQTQVAVQLQASITADQKKMQEQIGEGNKQLQAIQSRMEAECSKTGQVVDTSSARPVCVDKKK